MTDPGEELFFCPTVGEIESAGHGGFASGVCCDHPELHMAVPDTPVIQAISRYLSERAKADYAARTYDEKISAPMSPASARALAEKLADGTVARRTIKLPKGLVGETWCGAEPPGGLGADWTAPDGTQGTWGDCDCTKAVDHDGDHACEPCVRRFGAPSWPQKEGDGNDDQLEEI